MIKKIIFLCVIIIFINTAKSSAQNVEVKSVRLDGIGTVIIPTILDTVGQYISKGIILEKNLETLSDSNKAKFEKNYQIDLAKLGLKTYHKDVYFFWPKKSLSYLLDTLSSQLAKSDTTYAFDIKQFQINPNVLIYKNRNKVNSYDLKKFIDTSDTGLKELLNSFTDSWIKGLKLLFEKVSIDSISSSYFAFSNKYPTFKLSLNLSLVNDTPATQLHEVVFEIYKDNVAYVFRFDFLEDDSNSWIKYINNFIGKLKIL